MPHPDKNKIILNPGNKTRAKLETKMDKLISTLDVKKKGAKKGTSNNTKMSSARNKNYQNPNYIPERLQYSDIQNRQNLLNITENSDTLA